jgi:hypothetical protein
VNCPTATSNLPCGGCGAQINAQTGWKNRLLPGFLVSSAGPVMSPPGVGSGVACVVVALELFQIRFIMARFGYI